MYFAASKYTHLASVNLNITVYPNKVESTTEEEIKHNFPATILDVI